MIDYKKSTKYLVKETDHYVYLTGRTIVIDDLLHHQVFRYWTEVDNFKFQERWGENRPACDRGVAYWMLLSELKEIK